MEHSSEDSTRQIRLFNLGHGIVAVYPDESYGAKGILLAKDGAVVNDSIRFPVVPTCVTAGKRKIFVSGEGKEQRPKVFAYLYDFDFRLSAEIREDWFWAHSASYTRGEKDNFFTVVHAKATGGMFISAITEQGKVLWTGEIYPPSAFELGDIAVVGESAVCIAGDGSTAGLVVEFGPLGVVNKKFFLPRPAPAKGDFIPRGFPPLPLDGTRLLISGNFGDKRTVGLVMLDTATGSHVLKELPECDGLLMIRKINAREFALLAKNGMFIFNNAGEEVSKLPLENEMAGALYDFLPDSTGGFLVAGKLPHREGRGVLGRIDRDAFLPIREISRWR